MTDMKIAVLRCPQCGSLWDMFRCGDNYEMVPQIAPCDAYEAIHSQVCRPIFEAARDVLLGHCGLKPAA